MEQYFQDVTPKVMHSKNSEYFSAHFSKYFTQKPSPQKYRKIMSFKIISMENTISSMKTWGKLSCKLCMKEGI